MLAVFVIGSQFANAVDLVQQSMSVDKRAVL
jgi:hypothetical protein